MTQQEQLSRWRLILGAETEDAFAPGHLPGQELFVHLSALQKDGHGKAGAAGIQVVPVGELRQQGQPAVPLAFADFSPKEKNDIAENLGEIWGVNPQQAAESLMTDLRQSRSSGYSGRPGRRAPPAGTASGPPPGTYG